MSSIKLPTSSQFYTNFDLWMFGPGTVLGSKMRVADALIITGAILLFAILLILVIVTWGENDDLQKQVKELKKELEESMGPMKRALENTVGVFELKEAKGVAHGYPELDSLGKIPQARLPKMFISDSIPPGGRDASLVSSKNLPNAEMKILREGECIKFKETNSYVEISCSCTQ